MKIATYLFAFLPLLVFAREDPVEKIACGNCTIHLEIQVIDEADEVGIENAMVTFLTQREVRRIRLLERTEPTNIELVQRLGTKTRTKKDGLTETKVVFGYSTSTHTSGRITESRWPQGRFSIEHPNYPTLHIEARDLISTEIFDGMKIVVKLKKEEANKSSQTTPAKRPLFHHDLNPSDPQPTWQPN
jgi:hypothetical protein